MLVARGRLAKTTAAWWEEYASRNMRVAFKEREIVCRILYWGPLASGKTANLRALRARLPGASDTPEQDPLGEYNSADLGQITGFHVSASAPIGSKLLRLKGADVVVFVADSRAGARSANLEARRRSRPSRRRATGSSRRSRPR